MGFAVVDVNMRGTGCSGGAFDFFEPLQSLDGYDVIETIARQPWVKGHKVGMMGISYGGISQLFTARASADLGRDRAVPVLDATPTTLYPVASSIPASPSRGRSSAAHDAFPPRTEHRSALGIPTDPKRRHRPARRTRCCTARRRTCWRRLAPTRITPPSPTACPDDLRTQDQRPGLHGLPVARRANRRTLPRVWPNTSPERRKVVHLHQRRPHRRPRSAHVQPLVLLLALFVGRQAPNMNAGGVRLVCSGHLPRGDGCPRGCTLPADPIQVADVPRRMRRRRRSTDPGTVRQWCRRLAVRAPLPGSSSRSRVCRSRARGSVRWFLASSGVLTPRGPPRGAPTGTPGTRMPGRNRLHRWQGHGHGRFVGGDAALQWTAAAGRDRRVVPDRPLTRTRP